MSADRAQLRRERSLLDTLDRQRRQVDALITRLATGLSPAELAAAREASAAATSAHDGRDSPMPISFGRWAALLMPRLGAPACPDNLIVTVAWETQESTSPVPNTLGQFFTEWGVALTRTCVGSYCHLTKPHIYLDGKPYGGNPRAVKLVDRLEIAIVIGRPPKKIPSKVSF